MTKSAILIAGLLGAMATVGHAQTSEAERLSETIRQISTHIGEMASSLEASAHVVDDTIWFEPYKQLEEMFLRDYEALTGNDAEALRNTVSEGWVADWVSP